MSRKHTNIMLLYNKDITDNSQNLNQKKTQIEVKHALKYVCATPVFLLHLSIGKEQMDDN